MTRDHKTFAAACEHLLIKLSDYRPQARRQPRRPAAPDAQVGDLRDGYACFNPAWQSAADMFVTRCFHLLHSDDGTAARDYLAKRGITRQCAAINDLGYNPADVRTNWGGVGVWLPRGIVIPWQIDRPYWNVRIRRFNDLKPDDDKYMSPKGVANGLYLADSIYRGNVVVMVEGEFDAMLLNWAAAQSHLGTVRAVATGANTGARVLRWVARLSLASQVLLAFDADEAGNNACQYWLKVLGSNAVRLEPTVGKDITDMWQAGVDLAGWLRKAMGVEAEVRS